MKEMVTPKNLKEFLFQVNANFLTHLTECIQKFIQIYGIITHISGFIKKMSQTVLVI